MPLPDTVLLCPPDHFDVLDVKNPFMEGQVGTVDHARARAQWDGVRAALAAAGVETELLEPVEGCEDMVFCANPSFPGLDASGKKICVRGRMRYATRQPEVAAHAAWFERRGYEMVETHAPFEGGGDAIWHPGRALLWVGAGPRTSVEAHGELAEIFGVPVMTLTLATEEFYHLDTCFCPLDEDTAMIYPPAFAPESVTLIERVFERTIAVGETDARERMACNAAAFFGRTVVLQSGCTGLEALLRQLGYEPVPVDTDEFMKSGGSVYCMTQFVF